jgi:hypothetical protein
MTPDAEAVAGLARRLAAAMAEPGATAAGVAGVAGGAVTDDGPPLGLHAQAEVAGVQDVTVTRRWGGEEPNAAEIALAQGLALGDLEALLGAGRPVPARRPGDRRVVLGDGEGARMLASIDAAGSVATLTVSRD